MKPSMAFSISVLCSFAALVSVADAVASSTCQSEPVLVFLQTETSSFWNTATNNLVSVPIDFPPGATLATSTRSRRSITHAYVHQRVGNRFLEGNLSSNAYRGARLILPDTEGLVYPDFEKP